MNIDQIRSEIYDYVINSSFDDCGGENFAIYWVPGAEDWLLRYKDKETGEWDWMNFFESLEDCLQRVDDEDLIAYYEERIQEDEDEEEEV